MENLALDFINTNNYLNNIPSCEKLRDEQWKVFFSQKYNFSPTLFKDIDRLINLRNVFYSILINIIKEQKIPDSFLEELNEYLSRIQIKQKATIENNLIKFSYLPITKDSDQLYHVIVISFIDLLNEINSNRLKICQNEKCGWIFFDESKNKSRKWCSNKCASLIRVRNYRQNKES